MLSVCILSYNRRAELHRTLCVLHEIASNALCPMEIRVADNGSTDNTVTTLRPKFPEVRWHSLAKNLGMPGMNAALVAARGRYVLVLDDDSEPVEGLDKALEFMEHNPDVGVLALKIIGGPFSIGERALRGPIAGFIGCGALIRNTVIRKIGGYADWIFIYAHEFEYSLRVLAADFDIKGFPGCTVRHRTSPIHRSSERLRVETTCNELLIAHRYLGPHRFQTLKRRILFWNRIWFLREGLGSLKWVRKGKRLFEERKTRIGIEPVSDTVASRFIRTHWSTQPIFTGTLRRVLRTINTANPLEASPPVKEAG